MPEFPVLFRLYNCCLVFFLCIFYLVNRNHIGFFSVQNDDAYCCTLNGTRNTNHLSIYNLATDLWCRSQDFFFSYLNYYIVAFTMHFVGSLFFLLNKKSNKRRIKWKILCIEERLLFLSCIMPNILIALILTKLEINKPEKKTFQQIKKTTAQTEILTMIIVKSLMVWRQYIFTPSHVNRLIFGHCILLFLQQYE